MKSVIISILVFAFSYPAMAKERSYATWGKTGVSYDQYKRDSIDCAYVGYYRDVSKDKPTVQFIAGWRAADNALNTPGGGGNGWGDAILRTQPDRKRAEIQAIQTSDVEDCLSKRGYKQIELNRSETKRLAKLRKGSEARRSYLYSIATR